MPCFNPEHEDADPSCYVNAGTGLYFCQSCGWKGSLAKSSGIDQDRLDAADIMRRLEKLENPEAQREVEADPSVLIRYRNKHNYWESERGINEEMQELFELGYDPLADAVTIPLRRVDGSLIGVTRRFLGPEYKNNRYRYPRGFKASQRLFAAHLYESRDMRTVYITEGSIDAIRLWQNGYPGVAIYGSHLSPTHIEIMKQIGVERVVWFGDSDKEGIRAKKRAAGFDDKGYYNGKTDLARNFWYMHVDNHFGYKDAGSMPDKIIHRAIDSAKVYSVPRRYNR